MFVCVHDIRGGAGAWVVAQGISVHGGQLHQIAFYSKILVKDLAMISVGGVWYCVCVTH